LLMLPTLAFTKMSWFAYVPGVDGALAWKVSDTKSYWPALNESGSFQVMVSPEYAPPGVAVPQIGVASGTW
jgi:hypothetical protein